MNHKEKGCGRDSFASVANTLMNLQRSMKGALFSDQLNDYQPFKKNVCSVELVGHIKFKRKV
jgi:hypothetical protein